LLAGVIYSFCNLFDEIWERRGVMPMVKDYELREALKDVAKDMHDYNNNPSTWLSWLTYLLGQLEDQSRDVDPSNHERFMEMIEKLKDAVHTRKSRGGW
jgi:hypothetical protein